MLISESAFLARFAFPNDGSFISSRTVKMTIETVLRKIELPADEPFRERCFPLEYFFPRLSPNQFLRFSRPKCVRSSLRLAVHFSILGERFDACFLCKVFRGLEDAPLDQMRFDVRFHASFLISPATLQGKRAAVVRLKD